MVTLPESSQSCQEVLQHAGGRGVIKARDMDTLKSQGYAQLSEFWGRSTPQTHLQRKKAFAGLEGVLGGPPGLDG